MTSIVSENLPEKAKKCETWQWMPGMLALCIAEPHLLSEGFLDKKYRVMSVCEKGTVACIEISFSVSSNQFYPDITDPATLGCLLSLVRKAWKDPHFHVVPNPSRCKETNETLWDFYGNFMGKSLRGTCFSSEGDALIAALEAHGEYHEK